MVIIGTDGTVTPARPRTRDIDLAGHLYQSVISASLDLLTGLLGQPDYAGPVWLAAIAQDDGEPVHVLIRESGLRTFPAGQMPGRPGGWDIIAGRPGDPGSLAPLVTAIRAAARRAA